MKNKNPIVVFGFLALSIVSLAQHDEHEEPKRSFLGRLFAKDARACQVQVSQWKLHNFYLTNDINPQTGRLEKMKVQQELKAPINKISLGDSDAIVKTSFYAALSGKQCPKGPSKLKLVISTRELKGPKTSVTNPRELHTQENEASNFNTPQIFSKELQFDLQDQAKLYKPALNIPLARDLLERSKVANVRFVDFKWLDEKGNVIAEKSLPVHFH